MIDNSLPDAPPDEQDNGANGQKIYIPAPEGAAVGDDAEFSVKGSIESLHGDTVCVVPSEIDGQPAPDAPSEEEGQSEHDKLYAQAQAQDGYVS